MFCLVSNILKHDTPTALAANITLVADLVLFVMRSEYLKPCLKTHFHFPGSSVT